MKEAQRSPASSRCRNSDSLVAELAVGVESFPDIAAAMVVWVEAAGLVIFQQQVFVVVLAVDDQFDFDQIAAGDGSQIFQRDAPGL